MKVYNAREARKVVKENGFVLTRTTGDHLYYSHEDGRHISLPATKLNRMMWQRLVKENKLECRF